MALSKILGSLVVCPPLQSIGREGMGALGKSTALRCCSCQRYFMARAGSECQVTAGGWTRSLFWSSNAATADNRFFFALNSGLNGDLRLTPIRKPIHTVLHFGIPVDLIERILAVHVRKAKAEDGEPAISVISSTGEAQLEAHQSSALIRIGRFSEVQILKLQRAVHDGGSGISYLRDSRERRVRKR
ncbi:hypothetical protein B0H14DRAFT_2580898 [Mycena olivaceomarginata]|nr:hypothetical protein B0H14DRAFT_2580898 [Mycena olivaceomarginata]